MSETIDSPPIKSAPGPMADTLEAQHEQGEYFPDVDAEIAIIEQFISDENPGIDQAEITAKTDEIILDEANRRIEDQEMTDRILAAAAMIGEEGVRELEGKPTSGGNVIQQWELGGRVHGQYLDSVVQTYDELGRHDDAIELATAIDTLTTHDGQPLGAAIEYVAPSASPEVETQVPRGNEILEKMVADGEMSVEDAALVATLHAATELDPASQRKAFERTKWFVEECESSLGQEQGEQAVAALAELASRGADITGIEDLLQHSEGVKQYLALEPGRTGQEALVRLSRHTELHFAEGKETPPSSIVRSVVSRPEDYTPALDVLDERMAGVRESGYDEDVLAEQVKYTFGSYGHNGIRQGDSLAEHYKGMLDRDLTVMSSIGNSGIEFNTMLNGKKPNLDGFMATLANKLQDDPALDMAAERQKIEHATSSLDSILTEHPEFRDPLRQRINGSSAEKIQPTLDFMNTMTPLLPELAKTSRETEQVVIMRLLRDTIYGTGDAEKLGRMQHQAEKYIQITEAVPGVDRYGLSELLLSKVEPEASTEALSAMLMSNQIREAFEDEYLGKEVNAALTAITIQKGADIGRDLAITKEIGKANYLTYLVMAEGQLQGDEKETFFAHAETVLGRQDKNGNLYDSPEVLATAIKKAERYGGGHESFDWFVSSDLPVSAFESVAYFRADAKANGIEDDPKAIYEWIHHDPEKTAELSHHYANEYVGTLFASEGYTQDERNEMVATAGELVDGMSGDFRVFVNMTPETLRSISENDGVVRSTLELGGTQDKLGSTVTYDNGYLFNRSGIETSLGIRSLNDTEHPVYGSAGFVGDGVPAGAYGYGEVMLTFKTSEDLASRTSYTPEDSFHGADRLTERDAQILRALKTAAGKGSVRTDEYIESQIVGGVDIRTVDKIYVPREELVSQLPEGLREKAIVREYDPTIEAASSKGPEYSYKGTREKSMLADIQQKIARDRQRVARENPVAPPVQQITRPGSGVLPEDFGAF